MNINKRYIGSLSFTRGNITLGGGIGISYQDGKDALGSFSWFNGNTDNNKFFNDIESAEDLVPKESDFVRVPYRLISATVVGAGTYKATDFSNAKLLKSSMRYLEDKPIFYDHEQDIQNWVGKVEKVSWSKETEQDGMVIPAGINGVLAIDAKTNPKLARGALLGTVGSNSVTVVFEWEQSHPDMEEGEFYNKLGNKGSDGNIVARKVTKIYDYYETSLCWLGADPYAKRYDEDGNLVHVDRTSTAEEQYTNAKDHGYYSTKHSFKKGVQDGIRNTIISSFKKIKNDNGMDKELLKFISSSLGLPEGTELTKSHLESVVFVKEEVLKEHQSLQKRVAELAKASDEEKAKNLLSFLDSYKFVEKDVDVEALQADAKTVKELKDLAEFEGEGNLLEHFKEVVSQASAGKEAIEAKREETVRLYKIQVENKTDDSVLSMIAKASNQELDGMLKMYTKGATSSFSGTCKKCGSTEITFRSSVEDPGEELEENNGGMTDGSLEAIRGKYSKNKFSINN